MSTRYRPVRDLLAEVHLALTLARTPGARLKDPLENVVKLLHSGLGNAWTGIYLLHGGALYRHAYMGDQTCCAVVDAEAHGNLGSVARSGREKITRDVTKDPDYKACSPLVRSEAVIPIRRAGKVLGLIDVESNREYAYGPAKVAMLRQCATAISKYLTTSPGKLTLRHLREQAKGKASRPAKPPVSERNRPTSRAAAGSKH